MQLRPGKNNTQESVNLKPLMILPRTLFENVNLGDKVRWYSLPDYKTPYYGKCVEIKETSQGYRYLVLEPTEASIRKAGEIELKYQLPTWLYQPKG